MAKLPAIQFYVGDWRKDAGVQALSYHDRGIWFEILLLMHESCDRGKLLLNGEPMPKDALARILGIAAEELEKSLCNIVRYGVANLCQSSGLLSCRRMIRDEDSRKRQSDYGHLGGNPKLKEEYSKSGFVYFLMDEQTRHVKIGIAINVKNRVYKIQHSMGKKLTLLGSIPCIDMGKKEKELHDKYKKRTVVGEWFDFKDLDILTLKGELGLIDGGVDKGSVGSSSSSSISYSVSKESKKVLGTRFALQDPPIDWIQFCQTQRPDLDAGMTFDSFRDYWVGVAGAKGVKLDWIATWRNWVRNQKQTNKQGGNHARINQIGEALQRGLDRIERSTKEAGQPFS